MILRRLIIFSMLFIWILTEIFGSYLIPKMRRKGTEIKEDDKGSKAYDGWNNFSSHYCFFSWKQSSPTTRMGLCCWDKCDDHWNNPKTVVHCSAWTFFLKINWFSEGQNIVDKGPYSLIRHPAYTGTILTVLGYAVAERSILAIVLSILICVVIYGYRIRIEEKLLVSELGDAYVDYSKKTKRLIPYIL